MKRNTKVLKVKYCSTFQRLSIVEDKGCLDFIKPLQPLCKLPHRKHISSVTLPFQLKTQFRCYDRYLASTTDIIWK